MTIGSMLKKCLSCVLAIALLVSVVAPVSAVTATVSEGYDAGYVALGDAMTLGIGLEDESTEAYYALVAKALSDAGLIDDPDDIYSHANKKYRVEEIRYLVDYDYAGDGYTAALGSLSALRKTGMVKEYVTNADVITINAGVNNFSTYIIEQMLYYVENKGAVKYSYSFDEFADADVQEALDNVKSIVMEKLKGAADDQGDEVLDLINFVAEVSTYAILSYVTSFNAMIAGIYELNPDVDVYVVGIYNFAQGESVSVNGKELKMTYNGKEFAVDDFFGALVELANAYTQILAPRKYDYTYVDPGHPELLIDRMGNTNLSDDERIPDGLILELVELAGDAAVNEVIDIFAQYGIEKTEQWALGFLQELIDCDSDEERAEFIMDELNSYVVDEIIDTFQAELLEYLGQFATGEDVVTKDDVQKLLSDLDAAADLAEREAVAAEFVDDLIADPDLQNQAAAKVIHGYIDQYGLSGYVTVENVIVLLEELGECETEEQRKTTADDWVHNLAVTKITEYVQNVVGPENYSTTDASTMLNKMNADPDNAAAIARDCLLVDAFHGYMVAKFTETYTENGLVISTYDTIGEFVTAVESAATIDYAAEIVRTEVRYAAAGKVAADDTFKTWLGSTMTAADIAELFGGMDAASDEYAYLTEWMYDLFNADPSSNNFIIEYLIDLFASAYVSYDNAATAAVNAVTKYLEGLETASNAFGEYVDIQSEIVDKILEVYNENCTGEGLDLPGFADFDELRTTAISKILDGYEEYRKAIDTAMSSADSFNEYLDPVYDMLKEIAAVDVISLNDLMSVKDKVVAGGGTYIEDLRDRLVVSQDLADDELTAAYIVLRYYLADGMMIMPSVDGHATIANQIIKAVNGENTGSAAGNLANKVIDKAIDIYHLAKKYLSKPTTGSGQTTVLINPENYVALGDNITSGTALPNGTKTYVDLLSEALAMEFNDVADIDKDIISNLAINGMRTEELLALVDSNYNGDAYTEAKFDIPSLRAEYMEAITSAELITIEIGINNLVTYPMTQALLAYNGEDIYEMDWAQYFAQSRVDQVSAGKEAVMNLILHAIDNADSRLEDATGKSAYDECETALNTVATAVEALAYGVLGYMVNLDASVEAIAEANPDATIVLVGFYNPMVDTYIQIDEPVNIAGHSIDLSEYKVNTSAITAKVINQANRFLTNFVGFYADDLTAANEQSRIVTVSILNTELCISDSDASKDLSTLTDWKTVNVAGKEVTLKVPEYLLETLSTGGSALHPNAAGHEYIYNQILAALDYEIHADVIPEDNTKVYGEADPDLTYVMDDMSSLYELVVSLKREEGEDVGEYDIIATVVENGGYAEVDVVVGTFTITKRPVSVHVVVLDGEIDDVSVTGGSIADRDTNEDLTTLLGLVVDGNTVTASEDGNYDTEVTYEFHTSTPEDVDVYIKSYYSINDGTDFSYYGDTVPGFYAYAMFQNGDPVPADFNIVLDEVPVTGSPVGEYTISFTYTDVEGYNVVETVYCTWEIKARPISVDVTVVDGVITDVQITDGSIAACDEWDGTTAGLVDLLGLEVNVDAAAVTASNSNYNVTITSDFQSKPIQEGTISEPSFALVLKGEVHYQVKYQLTGFDPDQVVEFGLLQYYSKKDKTYDAADEVYVWSGEMDGDSYVSRTAGIPAKNLGDDNWFIVYVKLIDGTYRYSQRYVYSAVRYTSKAFTLYPNDTGLHALCISMLNYGTAAQIYFGHRTDELMNATYMDSRYQDLVADFNENMIDERLAARTSPYGEFDNKSSKLSVGNYNLSLQGAISLNATSFAYSTDGVIETGFVYWNHDTFALGETLTWDNKTGVIKCSENGENIDGTIEGSIRDIAASQMCDTFAVAAYVKTETGYHYCGISRISVDYYAEKIINGNYTDDMKDLAKYMVVYGEYAYNYFG